MTCLTSRNVAKEDIKVRCGDWDISNDNEKLPHENRNVKELYIHPCKFLAKKLQV